MELKKRSYLVRWAYLFDPSVRIPTQTSLCAIFWRCVLWTPLLLISAMLLGAGVIYVLSRLWRGVLLVAGSVLVTFGAIYALANFFDWIARRAASSRVAAPRGLTQSVLWQGARAVKSKICPVVRILD